MSDQRLPIGEALADWTSRRPPTGEGLEGMTCRLTPLAAEHASDLFMAFQRGNASDWTYMGYARPETLPDTRSWIEKLIANDLFYAIADKATGKAIGVAAYIRIDPANGSLEVAHINFAPALKRNRMGSEAIYLLIRHAFDDLGYRRCEWKCDSLNAASRRAALRYGFSFEGLFRQAMVYKGRNRDTAWYAIIDKDWPALRSAFEAWLDPDNFEPNGTQQRKLSDLTAAALRSR